MKTIYSFLITLFLTLSVILLNVLAQDNTKLSLPEGAKARLGKSRITGSIAYSPDGSLLAVPSNIGIWIYDAHSGKELNFLKGHTDWVKSVAFSPDGHLLASGSEDKNVYLWDASAGEHLKTFTHMAGVSSVCFSPDGHTLAGSGTFCSIRMWNVMSGKLKKEILRGGGILTFSPDGFTLASGKLGRIELWDVVSGTQKKTLNGPPLEVTALAFSPNRRTLASGFRTSRGLYLWDAITGTHLKLFNEDLYGVRSLVFSPDGRTLAIGGPIGLIHLWDVESGTVKKQLLGHKLSKDGLSDVVGLAFSPDGLTLASGIEHGKVLLWNTGLSTTHTPIKVTQQESTQQGTTLLTPQQIAKKALVSTVLIVMEDANGKPLSSGSGFFIGKGLIATNHHVVEKGTRGTYKRVGKNKWYNIIDTVKIDKQRDLAILKVSDVGAPALPLGASDEVQIGQPVYAVGNPIGFLEGTFAPGFVSSIRGKDSNKSIQITAPISPGSSGGPLLSDKGEVVGIVVGGITEGQNLNFAIPSNYLKELLDKVKNRK